MQYLGHNKDEASHFVSFLTLIFFSIKVINKYFDYFRASLTRKTQINMNKDECLFFFSISVLLVLLPQCMACQKPTAAIVKHK